MNNWIGKKVLATTQSWFFGKDGKQYTAVYGTLKGVHEAGKTLGFIPNRSHANWFVEIGNMAIMGCQIMYIEQCDSVVSGSVIDETTVDGVAKQYERSTRIYLADE